MLTNFPNGISSFGVPVMGNIGGIPFTGNYWFVNPIIGADGNDGTPELPLKTLYGALARCVSGHNDVVVLIGDGTSAGTARLSLALAKTITPAATSGTLNWNKNATHLIGVCSPTRVGQRARIAPPTGTYAAATFVGTNFVNVTGSGCLFSNIDAFAGFSAGVNGMVGWAEAGGRNAYVNCNIQGMADATSAAGSSSRDVVISSQENTFTQCTIGTDTVARSAANANIEFTTASARNVFENCIFPFMTSAATPIGIKSATGGMDRWQTFENCSFINSVQSGSTVMDGLSTLAASAGGLILMKNPTLVGITEFGTDATSRGQIYVDGAAPTAGTSGIAVNPT